MSSETTRAHVARNASVRERLVAVVADLDPAAYARPIGQAWMVKSALAHLAYSDRTYVDAIGRGEDGGRGERSNALGLAGRCSR